MRLFSAIQTVSFILGLSLLTSHPAHAEINVGESLDWLVLSRPHLAIARVLKVYREDLPEGHPIVETQIVTPVKGSPPPYASFHYYTPDGRVGSEFLIFFDEQTQVNRTIDLEFPHDAFTMDFQLHQARAAILQVVERRRAQPHTNPSQAVSDGEWPPRGSLHFEVPEDSPAWRALYSESRCYLIVPADPEFREPLLEQTRSSDVRKRAAAAMKLMNYADEEVRTVLHALLTDNGQSIMLKSISRPVNASPGEFEITVYPVRQAAYQALKGLGEDVPKPEGYRDDYPVSFLR